MRKFIKKNLFWLVLVGALAAYLGYALGGGAEHTFMPGESSHGHHQIELACTVCHTQGMGVKQDSCNECHKEELDRVDDSHPVVKFKDPRNAERLEQLDARYCISCHREHQDDITNPMGVTLPEDYCYYCHQEIGDERPSHADFAFDSCATAGCHNFHDNSALYERFLANHLDEPDFKQPALQRVRDAYQKVDESRPHPLTQEDADIPEDVEYTRQILHDWSSTAHANAGVNCTDCHNVKDEATGTVLWHDTPGYESCQSCHEHETKGFLEGKHGMRLAQGLSPMQPGMAKIPMRPEAAHSELSCASCHDSHRFNPVTASVDACLQCHNDDHSTAYKSSAHYGLFVAAQRGLKSPEEAVSCATCHMPRVERTAFGESFTMVDHNQNNSLRPNEKMIRSACIQCHGLQFTLNALADPELIQRNFQGRPSVFVESLELAREEQLKTTSQAAE
ncbi:MAG: hypothetical protein ACI81V_000655 [Lentimonas sp.]|jgi:hypothetical protein